MHNLSPIKLSTTKLNSNATAYQVVVSGSYAYLANGNDSLTMEYGDGHAIATSYKQAEDPNAVIAAF